MCSLAGRQIDTWVAPVVLAMRGAEKEIPLLQQDEANAKTRKAVNHCPRGDRPLTENNAFGCRQRQALKGNVTTPNHSLLNVPVFSCFRFVFSSFSSRFKTSHNLRMCQKTKNRP